MTCEAHPLPEAIAAAVPGPPIAALDAVRSACSQGTSDLAHFKSLRTGGERFYGSFTIKTSANVHPDKGPQA